MKDQEFIKLLSHFKIINNTIAGDLTEHKLKILITEDMAITALDLKDIIDGMGHEVLGIVKSGEEALAAIKINKPDLILMDVMLKGYYTGIETIEMIRKKHSIPVIYITALFDDETYLRAYLTKPEAILRKPFNQTDVKEAIHRVLKVNKVA
jgi:CheY-like chemotaxis protein